MSDPDEHTERLDPFGEPDTATKRPVVVALFDVLGFSKRLETFGLEAVVSTYQQLIDSAVLKDADRCLGLKDDGTGRRFVVAFALPVRYAYFSDTILLWVPLEQLFAAPFVSRCANLVCEALRLGVPLRGAIALGEAVMHKPTGIYIGAPIVEVARMEAAQKWIGMAFGETATWPPFLAELDPKLIIEYDAPLKEHANDLISPVVLDWPRRWRELYDCSPNEKLGEINAATPHPYYENTMAFANYSSANEDWHTLPEAETENRKLRMRKVAARDLIP